MWHFFGRFVSVWFQIGPAKKHLVTLMSFRACMGMTVRYLIREDSWLQVIPFWDSALVMTNKCKQKEVKSKHQSQLIKVNFHFDHLDYERNRVDKFQLYCLWFCEEIRNLVCQIPNHNILNSRPILAKLTIDWRLAKFHRSTSTTENMTVIWQRFTLS